MFWCWVSFRQLSSTHPFTVYNFCLPSLRVEKGCWDWSEKTQAQNRKRNHGREMLRNFYAGSEIILIPLLQQLHKGWFLTCVGHRVLQVISIPFSLGPGKASHHCLGQVICISCSLMWLQVSHFHTDNIMITKENYHWIFRFCQTLSAFDTKSELQP